MIRLEEIITERIQEGCPENNPPEDMKIILGDKKSYDAGDDKYDKEKEVTGLIDPTPADTEIGAVNDKNDNVKEVASLENPTTAAMVICAGDYKKDNEKEVASLKYPTPVAS